MNKDHLIPWPSKPSPELEALLVQLKQCGLSEATTQLLQRIDDRLSNNSVLVVWAKAGYNGLMPVYSVEEKQAAFLTYEFHKKDYSAFNPKLMRVVEKGRLYF